MNAALWAVRRLRAVAFPAAGEVKMFAYGKFKAISEKSEHA